jgi:hypothetical protein
MHFHLKSLCWACCALMLLSATATAGPLPTDPNAYLQGSALMSNTLGSNVLKSEVEYGVYAPGQFSASVALGNPVDPSGGTAFVYAYEIFDDSNGGNALVLNLSVGIDYLHRPTAIPVGWPSNQVGHVAGPDGPGVGPALSQFLPTISDPKHNIKWTYTTTQIHPGEHSDILIYTSPFHAHMFLSSMTGGSGTIASNNLPSPVPEPATAVLAVVAVICLLAAKCARRRPI